MPGARAAALSIGTAARREDVSTCWVAWSTQLGWWEGGRGRAVPDLEIKEGFLEEVMQKSWPDSGRQVSMAAKW